MSIYRPEHTINNKKVASKHALRRTRRGEVAGMYSPVHRLPSTVYYFLRLSGSKFEEPARPRAAVFGTWACLTPRKLDVLSLQKFGLLFLILAIILPACATNPLFQANTEFATSPVATLTPAPISLELKSATAGLADLQSYRAKLTVDFEGTRNGQPAQGRLESLTEVTRQPAAWHQYLKVNTTLTSTEIISGVSEFYRAGDQVYVKRGTEGAWFSFSDGGVSPADLGFFALDRLIVLPAVVSAPQAELLDSQKTQRFSFTGQDLAAPNLIFEQAAGDLWLAQPDKYLAHYVISATVRVVIPDPKVHLFDQGRLTLRYTVSDANAELTITPPDEAQVERGPLSRLPRLPDAKIVSIFPTFIEYTSAITPIAAALFYRDQLITEGWSENQADIFNEKARLLYAKNDESLTVLITPGEERDKIKVLLDLK